MNGDNKKGPRQAYPQHENTWFRVAPSVQMGVGAEPVTTDHTIQYGCDGSRNTTITTVHTCNGCRAVMHKPEEVGGVCAVCDRLLCIECSKVRCAICNQCMCHQHSGDTSSGRACFNHGFLRILFHSLSRRREESGKR